MNWASLVAQIVKNLPVIWDPGWSLGWEDLMEEGMAIHSSILAGEFHGQRSLVGYNPWSRRVGHNWATNTYTLVNRLTNSSQSLAIQLEMFCKTENGFTSLSHCLSLSILPFDFNSSLLLSLHSTKEPGIQTQTRWAFWDSNLLSSQSAGSLNKVLSQL